MNHGGKRAGAGRPALKNKKERVSFRATHENYTRLKKEDKPALIINQALEKHFKKIEER